MKIVLDTQGGDNPPQEIIKGGIEFAKETGEEVFFVGDREILRKELSRAPQIKSAIIHAPEVITMKDAPVEAIRQKKNSSLVTGINFFKKGLADAFISPANTGAVMAASLFRLGRLPRIDRPGIIIALPTLKGGKVFVIDVGANADCAAHNLLQFAVMGQVYANIQGIANPTVGLLSIGQESSKGNRLTLEAHAILREFPNFVGNIESNKVLQGGVDLVVCDGFSGNLILKAYPSAVDFTLKLLKREIEKTFRTKFGGWLIKPAIKKLRPLIHPAQYGGAPLLGVNGLVIIAHGHSDSEAIKNALKVAKNSVENQLISKIKTRLNNYQGC
ncbi:MAG: phosphate acyltransferase PlsX [bacterium]